MTGTAQTVSSASIDTAEVEKFSRIAAEWWDPAGKFAPLHKFNPVRLGLIRETVAEHFARDPRALRPFEGLALLDIGCGGGLLSEPMAKIGFAVTGIDPSDKNIGTARIHAAQSDVTVDYRAVSAEALLEGKKTFDVVLNMEVVEHVADLRAYLKACAQLVNPGGLMFVATINRTLKALALAKVAAEYVLRWLPPGTHDWNRFVSPGQLRGLLADAGMTVLATQGVSFDLLGWDWRLSNDLDVNYIVIATREKPEH